MLMLLIGLLCFARGWVLLHMQQEEERLGQASKKANTFMAIGIAFIAVIFLFLMIIVDWSVRVKAGIVFAGSVLPLVWAACYSRASLLYGREKEPAAMSLGLLGTLIAVSSGEAIFYPFHFPLWFPFLYGIGVLFLVTFMTCLLQIHWQKLRRQRRSLEELDPETMINDEKEAGDERFVLNLLLLLTGCLLIAAGVPVALFYRGVSLIWAAIFICSLSAVLIFWGEYSIRAHLLYGYEKKPGMGWAVFLGVLFIFFYALIYISAVLDLHSYDFVFGLFIYLAWEGQARLSRRWNKLGEQQRQIIRPGTDLSAMIEQETNISE